MSSIDFTTAELLAADLRGKGVDHNEVKKLLSYMRSQQSGRALFDYLQLVLKHPKVVSRSNQTPDHFQAMLEISERHLRPLQGDYQQLMATLGWGYRLMRYYKDKDIPTIAPRHSADKPVPQPVVVATPTAAPAAPAKPTGQSLLEVGATFYGKIIEVGKIGVLIEVPNYALDKVIGIIKTENLAGKRYTAGKKNTANVEVIGSRSGDKGEIVLDLRPAQKQGG